MRGNKGITLIIVVLTVVILAILVLLSIDLVVNKKLFSKSKTTVEKANNQLAQDQNIENSLLEDWDETTGTSIKTGTKAPPCREHKYGEWQITQPTCLLPGKKTRECTVCGAKQTTTSGAALGHNYVDGVCSRCGAEEPKVTVKPGVLAKENAGYTDDAGNTAIIPKGFTVSDATGEKDISTGLVIYDIPESEIDKVTWDGTEKTKYNQFVWIPVEVNKTTEPKDTETSIASFKRSVWQDNARVANNAQSSTSFPSSSYSWSDYTEPYSKDSRDYDGTGTGKTGISAQITELTKSIYKYGGFYIGRYEAGSETERGDGSSQTAAFVVQQDKYPYNYVNWGKGMGDISEGAVYLSNSLYTGKTGYGVKSMLCTGAAWDSMLDFVKDSNHSVTDSTTWGNYKNSETFEITRGSYAVLNTSSYTLGSFNNVESNYSKMKGKSILLTTGATGATERNSSKNIYDVAGNCYEWTTEAYDASGRVVRGGRYDKDGSGSPASDRYNVNPTGSYNGFDSFRPLLYVAL